MSGRMPPSAETINLESLSRGSGALLISAFVAALVPALASKSMFVLAGALFVTLAHAAILGAPLFLLFRRFGWANRTTSILAGLAIGVIPAGIEKWPSESNTGHMAIIDNIPTRVFSAPIEANWSGYAQFLILPGVLGALAGFTFWFSLRIFRRADLSAQDRAKDNLWRNPIDMVTGFALIVIASTSAYSAFGAKHGDTTCHNMFRDGRTSIKPTVNMGLAINIEDWGALAEVFEEFSTAHALSLRKFGTLHPETVRTISLSLCSEAGFNIETSDQRWAHRDYAPIVANRGTPVSIFETRDGSSWQEIGAKFADALEARWPGKLKFISSEGREIARPDIIRSTNP
jgi:hypothetical protein